jgi:hypothetical protein
MAVINSHAPDPCCGKHLSKALRTGMLDTVMHWECPKCGTQWKPTLIAGVRHWQPVPYYAVL